MTIFTGHFQSFFSFSINISRTKIIIIFLKIRIGQSLLKMSLKNTQTEPRKYIIFGNETNNI